MLQLIILTHSVLFNNVEYNVVGFTGATSDINDYIYLKVKGIFKQLSTIEYHIKPNKINEEIFLVKYQNLKNTY
jgi:hypothetical protein